MTDYNEERLDKAHTLMSAFVKKYMEENDGVLLIYEIGMMLFVLLYHARQAMKWEELRDWLIMIAHNTEASIRRAKDKDPGAIILAEDWRDMEGGLDMLRAIARGMDTAEFESLLEEE